MASNYTQHQLLQRVAVMTNKEYDNYIMNKEALDLWYKVHTEGVKSGTTSRIKRFFTKSKDG
jgi:hypothetical protein